MSRIPVLAACVLLPLTAAAQSDPPEPAKKTCRMLVPTGSIMAKRVCLTDKEWREFDARNGENSEQGLEGRRRGLPVERTPDGRGNGAAPF